jgi:hypothetical protein
MYHASIPAELCARDCFGASRTMTLSIVGLAADFTESLRRQLQIQVHGNTT